MNRLVRRIVVVVLTVLPTVAFAQVPQQVITDNPVTYGLGGGVSVPIGDAEKGLDRGFVGQGFARFRLAESAFHPRVDVAFQKFDLKGGLSPGTASMLSGTVNLQLFIGGSKIRPYAVGGIGAYYVRFETNGAAESSTRFGLNGGGGLAFRVNPRLSIYGEIRLDNVLNDEGPVDSDLQVVPLTFGVTF